MILMNFAPAMSQSMMPVIRNERGDTVKYSYPPPDSCFRKNHLIMYFKPNALNLNLLCYEQNYITDKSKNKDKIASLTPGEISFLMKQKFYVDDIIADSNFNASIKSFGGDSLYRMTWANPCSDTISIARSGDSLRCDDFLWMVLKFNNDTSVITAAFYLTYFFQSQLNLAEPDYYLEPTRTPPPNDGYYQSDLFNQFNLNSAPGLHNSIDMNVAWVYEVGNYNIKISIMDNGIWYDHCDLGSAFGLNNKVSDGWDYTRQDDRINRDGTHGTQVAGIIGALTNRNCGASEFSIAGIAGGWGGETPDNIGCQLMGFRINDYPMDTTRWLTSWACSAIRVASSHTPGYGKSTNIINNSWIIWRETANEYGVYSEALRCALNYAFQNNVSIVCAAGNQGSAQLQYPASHDPSWITCVGGSQNDKTKDVNSPFSKFIDVIAPYSAFTISRQSSNVPFYYEQFYGTSASAPHVTGVIGLIQSYAYEQGWNNQVYHEPEDYDGIVKASATDINPSLPDYDTYFDIMSGWGHLQADKAFQMINEGYRISHYNGVISTYGDWVPASNDNPDKLDWIFNDNSFTNKPLITQPQGAKHFKVRFRGCNGDIVLPDDWVNDGTHKIYVWGRSNRNGLGGYSNANPNYQTNYTQVTSGLSSGHGFTDGIILDQGLTVSCKTFQYDVWDETGNNYIDKVPSDQNLAINISVFGLPKSSSVKIEGTDILDEDIKITPNPVSENCLVNFKVPCPSLVKINIRDIFGNDVISSKQEFLTTGIYQQTFNLSGLASGVYFCNIFIKDKAISKSFTLIH